MTDAALPLRSPKGAWFDPIFRGACFGAAVMLLASLAGVIIALMIGGWPAISKFGFGFLTSVNWDPANEIFGAAGPIVGTLISSFLALLIALPLAIGVAVFLVEFCPAFLSKGLGIAVELLAGVPSIVYGMWGLFVFAPAFAQYVQLPLFLAAPAGSIWAQIFAGVPNGANIFTASVILAIMILPYMSAVMRELLLTVPPALRESAYGLGCTSLETVTRVTMPFVSRGMIGVVMLGLGRALGETMAVTFVIGNTHAFPKSLFDSGSTIASTIANEFNEATGAMHTSALIALGLVLFLITFSVLAAARALLASQRYE